MSKQGLSDVDTATSSSHGTHETHATAISPTTEDPNVKSTFQVNEGNIISACTANASTSLICSCYDDQITRIAKHEIGAAVYRLKMGVIYLLDEDNAMTEARSRAVDLITYAARDAQVDIINEGHDEHSCKMGETAQMKAWQRWHVEWKCNEAERHFKKVMEEDPRREDRQRRHERYEARRAEKYGDTAKPPPIESGEDDDVRHCLIEMHPFNHITFPGCKCVLWGAGKMANTAWNEAVSSFGGMYPVASDWGDLLLEKIEMSTQVALEEVREIVERSSEHRAGKAGVGEKTSKDHFPEWQQEIVKGRVDVAVEEAKKRIMSEKGVPGAVAKAAKIAAEDHYHQYGVTAAAREAARKDEERLKRSPEATVRAPGGLAAAEKVVESAEIV